MIKSHSKKGFTLSEVMVVVIIIGIIAGLSFPRFTVAVERMRSSEGVGILTALLSAQKRFNLENGQYRQGSGGSSEIVNGDLDIDIPASPNFLTPYIYGGPGVGGQCTPIAVIIRPDPSTNPMYVFFIDEFGNLWCTDGGSYNFCSKMGYRTTCP